MSIDYTGFAFPKNKIDKTNKKSKKELCIMPKSNLYKTEREEGLIRHEVFYGNGKRQLSIKYGLVIFITPKMHNMSNKGIHFNKDFDLKVKKIGQAVFKEKYPELDFIKIFGKEE